MKRFLRLGILLPAFFLGMSPAKGPAQIGIAVSVNVAPPLLPVYEQPPCPVEGYLWTPGYWAWDPDYGYYWVPGVWVAPPQPGLLWTPGYWAFTNGAYGWNDGYWGPQVGYYGGVDYGWGYDGVGFVGGMWAGNVFRYNTAVVRVNTTVIHNVYVNRTVVRREGGPRASFNGPGGVTARPTARDEQVMHERHFERTAAQTQRIEAARRDPQARFAMNHGAPRAAAMARVGQRAVGATNHPSAAEVRAAQAQSRGAHSAAATRRGAPTAHESRPAPGRNESSRSNGTRPEARPARPAASHTESRSATPPRSERSHSAARPETHSAPRPESRPAARPKSRPTTRPESRPEARPESHPAARPESRPTARPESHTEARPESHPAPHPESRSAARPESRPEERPAPHPQARPESHPAPHAEEKPH